MSNFNFECPFCGQNLDCDESLSGKVVKCPSCGEDVVPLRDCNKNDTLSETVDKHSEMETTFEQVCIVCNRKGFLRKKEAVISIDLSSGKLSISGEDSNYYTKQSDNGFVKGFQHGQGRFFIKQNSSEMDFSVSALIAQANGYTHFDYFMNGNQISFTLFIKHLFDYKIKNNGIVELIGGRKEGSYTDCLRLSKNAIAISHSGILNALSAMGIQGEKRISFDNITAIQIKEPGVLPGYMQFSIMGEIGRKDGVFGALGDENTITIRTKEQIEIAKYIQNRIELSRNSSSVSSGVGYASEIIKLKELLDSGVISKDDFSALVKKISK